VTRPRLLLPLALVALLYGAIGIVVAWTVIGTVSIDHDQLVSAMRESGASDRAIPGFDPKLGTKEEQLQLAQREAEALWSRRGVLIPLSIANLIAATLIVIGAARVLRRGTSRAWGRSAWQLGTMLSLPCVALACIVGVLYTHDLLAAVADLHDPMSQQLREGAPLFDLAMVGLAALPAICLAGVALYLRSAAVMRWVGTEKTATRDA
jgi:hypothetical protein